jgi:hypothetical protein
VKLQVTISCFVMYCGCHISLEIWIAILKGTDFLDVIAINRRIILKCSFAICGLHLFGSEWGPVMDCSKHTD